MKQLPDAYPRLETLQLTYWCHQEQLPAWSILENWFELEPELCALAGWVSWKNRGDTEAVFWIPCSVLYIGHGCQSLRKGSLAPFLIVNHLWDGPWADRSCLLPVSAESPGLGAISSFTHQDWKDSRVFLSPRVEMMLFPEMNISSVIFHVYQQLYLLIWEIILHYWAWYYCRFLNILLKHWDLFSFQYN